MATLQNAKLQTIVWTADVAQAAAFYSDVLGLRQTGMSHGAAVFDVGGQELRVSPVPETSPTEHTVVGFAVEDLASVVRDLNAKGLDMERLDGFSHDDKGILKTPEGAAVAWIRDPDGNLMSLVQYN